MRFVVLLAGGLVLSAAGLGNVEAQPPKKKEALADQVRTSIEHGVEFLKKEQRANGSWEVSLLSASPVMKDGPTALALLALLNAGVPVTDKKVSDGLKYLRQHAEPDAVYVRALQTMVFVEAGLPEDRAIIQKNVEWLINARVIRDGKLEGWSYYLKSMGKSGDGSNTQYAVLGLWAGKQAGVAINREIWQSIRDFYIRTQGAEGFWSYSIGAGERGASLTMTAAGVCALLVAAMELNAACGVVQKDGTARKCGDYDENTPAARGLGWISGPARDRFQLDLPNPARTFYNLYGIERVGRLSGQRFIGGHDWYREGCKFLVQEQQRDGSWSKPAAGWDQWPVVSTSFALLFLSKGRTPVLISKLVHGDWNPRLEGGPRDPRDTDWNNDRNDLRHLTEFCSRDLFKGIPLAWQTFDMMRALAGRAVTEETMLDVTSEMLQAPIAYFNGHKSPLHRFSDNEKEVLKRFVDNGGFLFVEACCGRREFDAGFKELARRLWPDNPLQPLAPGHPVWEGPFKGIKPGSFGLMGIELGCKTVVIYSPEDMSCFWEGNNLQNGKSIEAFRVGANIIAYATGMEPPRPRGTQVELKNLRDDPRQIRRNFLKVAQIKHGPDWQPAPRAMSNLMAHMRDFARLDVTLQTEEMPVHLKSIVDFKFIYMHGRGEFSFGKEELEHLRFNLENGGLLFADACCGKEPFDKSFRAFMQDLFPKHKLQRIPVTDELFSKDLNGVPLTEANIECRTEKAGKMQSSPPWLEGIKLNDRWVVIYSKYDIGCALERHKASDCLGYSPDSAFKLAGAAVLYTLKP